MTIYIYKFSSLVLLLDASDSWKITKLVTIFDIQNYAVSIEEPIHVLVGSTKNLFFTLSNVQAQHKEMRLYFMRMFILDALWGTEQSG